MEAREGAGPPSELAGVLYASAEILRILAILVQPIMPSAAQRLWEQLGVVARWPTAACPATSRGAGSRRAPQTVKGESLFPRLDPV